jgi:hypothetical protein
MGEDPNKNVEFRDEHEMPMDIPGFNDTGREPDVQDFVRDGDIFEQGIIRIKGNLYIAILVYKKIVCLPGCRERNSRPDHRQGVRSLRCFRGSALGTDSERTVASDAHCALDDQVPEGHRLRVPRHSAV